MTSPHSTEIISKPAYRTEFILRFEAADRFVFRISDMSDLNVEHIDVQFLRRLDECHIYLIGKRPRVSLIPSSISIDSEFLRFELGFRSEGTPFVTKVEVPRNIIPANEVAFEASPYPHRELISKDDKGNVVARTVLANYATFVSDMSVKGASDIEVMYIGKGLRKSAHDRLANHSTLQKILASINSNDPDAEVFALVYAFVLKKDMLHFEGVPVEATGETSKTHNTMCVKYKPTVDEQVSIVEASLIAYFRTQEFNTHYLDFPLPSHSILSKVVQADFAAIIVSVDNSAIGGQRLFSKHVPANSIHEAIINLRHGS
jgi:hypothetical protein